MAYKLFIGSLAWATKEDSLREAFEKFGEVESVAVITDRETGRSKGFGFVEFANEDDGKKAIEEMNNSELDGRNIIVNEARPKAEKPRSW